MDGSITGGLDWGTWAAGIGDKLITAAIDAKVNYPHQTEQLKINKLGALGYYAEGQPGILGAGGLSGIPPGLLLIGAGVLVYLLVKG